MIKLFGKDFDADSHPIQCAGACQHHPLSSLFFIVPKSTRQNLFEFTAEMICMCEVIAERLWLGSTHIESLGPATKSSDYIPSVLIGLQAIRIDEAKGTELFRLLDGARPSGPSPGCGLPGLDITWTPPTTA